MRIYIAGIGGVGMGPLGEIALDAGYSLCGSDLADSDFTHRLAGRGAQIAIGAQDGSAISTAHETEPIDWFVYTSALRPDNPELVWARAHGIKVSKRDELIRHIVDQKGLKLLAIAGTHGKTTTTAMAVWICKQLGIPVSYSIGTGLSWAASGRYDPESEYFIYECDEYDRNMLSFFPHMTVITSLNHDHPDTYPTEDDYRKAFVQFLEQSDHCMIWERDLRYLHQPDISTSYDAYDELMDLSHIKLPGDHTRHNGMLAIQAVGSMSDKFPSRDLVRSINDFPGTMRRFEKLAPNLYTDYAHHPDEIAATLQMASDINTQIIAVYQPHQNRRQYEVRDDYRDAFSLAKSVYWLPTYLSREDPNQPVLSPAELIAGITHPDIHQAQMDEQLWDIIARACSDGYLVLVMGAGDIDAWTRRRSARLSQSRN